MDHAEFLKKLSEVADWEYRNLQGVTNHDFRADTEGIENPKYIHIKKLKSSECDPANGKHNNTIIKNYTYLKHTTLVERCPSCGMAKTKNSDWFKINHISSLPAQAHHAERGTEPSIIETPMSVSTDFSGNYVVEESEIGVIKRWVDK